MIIYKDIFTGDELCSDSYTQEIVDDIVIQVQTKAVTKSEGDYVPSNDEDGPLDANVETVNNVVDAHSLVETGFKKKEFITFIKDYMKRVALHLKEKNPERVAPFKKAASQFVSKKLLPMFKELQFFTGESMEEGGMIVMMFYKEGATHPCIWLWKDGIEEVKY
mmetsp:Transcript_17457/g.19438  ORF Transcript_17457/g.19438 Transcript_17457/m.19438 type:complete len:164 (-) Transcript_17457:115-606(-)|eukprot:CAMPEP_0168508850 /NCGR_PEP_ID=MMETSP0405-20121227/384_1 /TAXON_ID=498012 /ORGANISM="Trichosphaerium sp, Strain Am-I-7 wt" /LENGTH=163 /DNA_ID=CAMNT_0008526113 /DNA_START=37 /DNA_END=528 /DNA_ORIENTATION=+